ncbi:MAG TPA: protein kinase [Steroidobacteraceae bacterium]|nr:protein kinase [Steroidobacteraceae bacterium]
MSGNEFNPGSASGLSAGDFVGPYELIRLLGAGGMAEVWLARRADGAFKRDVALKLPLLTRRRKDLEQRFAHERDILASLEHPNIARFYDAGVDAEGLPYLSMEYVNGQALIGWCDARVLGVEERLALFLQVLDAVKYAHEKHVIHRDLKPSNIFVTESGQVRLLDFGVAKLLQEDADQTQLSRIYGQALTPDYASPELLRGEPVDPRSDVYSLGMLLYELLTGTRPYRLSPRASLAGLRQAVASADVKSPSTQLAPQASAARAATQEQLARKLRGDLDALVLKALAKEPAERYDGAASMAQDLQRYLQGQPVKARLAPLSDRAGKFLRRNSAAAWLVAMSIIAICAAVGLDRLILPRRAADSAPPAAFAPPVHSVAVLPFTNLSGDPRQDYFSDGVSEELINALSHVEALQVSARTSSFSFKGKNLDVGAIARKLNVAAILEGSIRRSGDTVRITAQLVDTINGYHIWSQNYDRDLKDILTLQTDIATAVAQELQVKLLGDEAARIEVGSTRNAQAYDAYLRGLQIEVTAQDAASNRLALAAFDQAISLDPNFAAAYTHRVRVLREVAYFTSDPGAVRDLYAMAREAAERAVALAPDYADAHMAFGWQVLVHGYLDFAAAEREVERAMALAPGSASVLDSYAGFEGIIGHHDAALAAMRHAIKLDPQNPRYREHLLQSLTAARRFDDVPVAVEAAKALHAEGYYAGIYSAISDLALGRAQPASNLCESQATPLYDADRHFCLALAYHALGKLKPATTELQKLKALDGDLGAVSYAAVYAQWGDPDAALQWLATAERLHRASLAAIKVDWMFDPIRTHPQFQALERRLNFPP